MVFIFFWRIYFLLGIVFSVRASNAFSATCNANSLYHITQTKTGSCLDARLLCEAGELFPKGNTIPIYGNYSYINALICTTCNMDNVIYCENIDSAELKFEYWFDQSAFAKHSFQSSTGSHVMVQSTNQIFSPIKSELGIYFVLFGLKAMFILSCNKMAFAAI